MTIAQLHTIFLKHPFVCTDTRKLKQNDLFFALKGANFNGNVFAEEAIENGAAYAIIDEEKYHINAQTILVENVLTTLQELATFHRQFLNIPIIALTGSNGKTTTKELINAVLSKQYNTVATVGNLNNHIGVPLTLLAMGKNTQIGIVEMGANHKKEIEFLCSIAKPNYGYITNFGKAHLEGFGGIEGVLKGKSELYDFLRTNNKTVFVNAKDSTQLKQSTGIESVFFNKDSSEIKLINSKPFLEIKYKSLVLKSNLTGQYNLNNIAAAISIGNYFKISDLNIKNAIEHYTPNNNRSQLITQDNNTIILDAYNANPTSMKAALDNLNSINNTQKIAVLGDMFELGKYAAEEHNNITRYALQLNLDKIILVGEHFFETTINSETIIKFKSFENLKSSNFNLNTFKGAHILIKGSRGMALERILTL